MAERRTVESLPVYYEMRNNVNGRPIRITGGGSWTEAGDLRIKAKISEIPNDWSGVIVPCICSGPGPGDKPVSGGGGGLLAIAVNGYRTSPGTYRVASLFDQNGVLIAAVRATGVYARSAKGLSFQIDVETKTARDSVISRLTKVHHYSFSILPNGPGRVCVYAHYGLTSDVGEVVYGWTHIYYDLIGVKDELVHPIVGSNQIDVSIKDTTLNYSSRQRTVSVSQLGQPWI